MMLLSVLVKVSTSLILGILYPQIDSLLDIADYGMLDEPDEGKRHFYLHLFLLFI